MSAFTLADEAWPVLSEAHFGTLLVVFALD